jgi:DGQHR domain-containing protein
VKLRIDLKDAVLYVPDGQHRAFGLSWAVDQSPGEIDDYEMPMVLFVADGKNPRYEEAQQFFTINNNAKRVKTDLAQRYLLLQREAALGAINDRTPIPGDATLKELEPYAVKIADMLNQSGALEGMIEPPNMSVPTASISQNSFIDSIKPLLAVASTARWDVGKVVDTVNAYWSAIKSKMPEAFAHWSGDDCDETNEDHFNAVLVTTTGMYALNAILAKMMLLPEVAARPTSPEIYKKLLDKPAVEDYFSDGADGYWGSDSTVENSASSRGTSRKSFKELADEVWDNIVGA